MVLRALAILMLLNVLDCPALAQRDPPLMECYLPSIMVSHSPGKKLTLDLVLKKETGPVEHREHQMLLLAYLVDDEESVLKIASDPELLDKTKGPKAMLFLDVLLEKGLVANVDSKVAARRGFAGQDNLGKYADGSKAGRSREEFLKLNAFAYTFAVSYKDLFDDVSKLKNFSQEAAAKDSFGIYAQRFKLLAFVPVNDCKYATKVREGIRGKYDFGLDEYMNAKTPILYCRPLPYEFEIRRSDRVGTIVYIR